MSRFIGMLCLLYASLACADTVESVFPFTGEVKHTKVRLRTAPSLESHILREIYPGELFAVVGEEGDFFAIAPESGTKGFVFRTLILENRVEGDKVNVRLYPDMEAPIIGKLPHGTYVEARLHEDNPKWYEVTLPDSCRFYIAKDFIHPKGDLTVFEEYAATKAKAEAELEQFTAQVEDLRNTPFDRINLINIESQVQQIKETYGDYISIAQQTEALWEEVKHIHAEKKEQFLEQRAQESVVNKAVIQLPMSDAFDSTERMNAWIDLEEAMYYEWRSTHPDQSIEAFYEDQQLHASLVSGTVEHYHRPVHNRPGDFILRHDNVPVAFIYSTKIDLAKLVGKKIVAYAVERPNNNFAFPAYFVLQVE